MLHWRFIYLNKVWCYLKKLHMMIHLKLRRFTPEKMTQLPINLTLCERISRKKSKN